MMLAFGIACHVSVCDIDRASALLVIKAFTVPDSSGGDPLYITASCFAPTACMRSSHHSLDIRFEIIGMNTDIIMYTDIHSPGNQ